jgi:hypothetical protein
MAERFADFDSYWLAYLGVWAAEGRRSKAARKRYREPTLSAAIEQLLP